jgi:hypothetical protein
VAGNLLRRLYLARHQPDLALRIDQVSA